MIDEKLKIFRLNYSGSFNEVSTESPLDLFTLYDILGIYSDKHLFFWIGQYASTSLRIFIPHARELFSKDHPELRVLRNITIESGSETFNFMENFEFTGEELEARIKAQEEKILPVLSEIDKLKEKIDDLIDSEEFNKAYGISDEIIELARKIEDKALEKDQQNLKDSIEDIERRKIIGVIAQIDELRITQGNHERLGEVYEAIRIAEDIISIAEEADLEEIVREQEEYIARLLGRTYKKYTIEEVKAESKAVRNEFDDLVALKKINEAQEIVQNFVRKYQDYQELPIIPAAQYFISKDEELWQDFTSGQENARKELVQLEYQFNKFVEANNRKAARNIIEDAWSLLFKLNDEALIKKWAKIENDFAAGVKKKEVLKKSDLIKEVERTLINSSELMNNFSFKEALVIIDSMLKYIKTQDLPECEKKLEEKRNELIEAEQKYNKITKEIRKFERILEKNRKDNDLKTALLNCEKIIELSGSIGDKAVEDKYSEILEQLKKQMEISLNDINALYDECNELIKNFQIDKAILKIDSMLELLKNQDFTEYVDELKEKRKEYMASKEKLDKINEEISKLEGLIKENQENRDLNAALLNCEKIVQISEKIGNDTVLNNYSKILEQVKEELNELNEKIEFLDEECSKLVENFQYRDAIKKIDSILELLQNENLPEYKKLDLKRKELIDAEEKYKRINDEISRLGTEIKNNLKAKNVNAALQNCEKIIEISEPLGIKWAIDKYTLAIEEIKREISDIKEIIKNLDEECSKLVDRFQFEDAISKIDSMLELLKEQDFPEYKKKLEEKRKELIVAKEKYEKLIEEVKKLEKIIEENRKNKDFKTALQNCEKIITVSKTIGNDEILGKYTQIFEDIKKLSEAAEEKKHEVLDNFDEFKSKIIELNNNGLELLNKGAIKETLEVFEKVINKFEDYKKEFSD